MMIRPNSVAELARKETNTMGNAVLPISTSAKVRRPASNPPAHAGGVLPAFGTNNVSPYDEERRLRLEVQKLRQRNKELMAENRTNIGNLKSPYWQEAQGLLDHVVQAYYSTLVSQAKTGDSDARTKSEGQLPSLHHNGERPGAEEAAERQAWSAAFPWLRSAQELGQHELQQARTWYVSRVDAVEQKLAAAQAKEEALNMEVSALSAIGTIGITKEEPANEESGPPMISLEEHKAAIKQLRVEQAAHNMREREKILDNARKVAADSAAQHAEQLEKQFQLRAEKAKVEVEKAKSEAKVLHIGLNLEYAGCGLSSSPPTPAPKPHYTSRLILSQHSHPPPRPLPFAHS